MLSGILRGTAGVHLLKRMSVAFMRMIPKAPSTYLNLSARGARTSVRDFKTDYSRIFSDLASSREGYHESRRTTRLDLTSANRDEHCNEGGSGTRCRFSRRNVWREVIQQRLVDTNGCKFQGMCVDSFGEQYIRTLHNCTFIYIFRKWHKRNR